MEQEWFLQRSDDEKTIRAGSLLSDKDDDDVKEALDLGDDDGDGDGDDDNSRSRFPIWQQWLRPHPDQLCAIWWEIFSND